MRKKRRLRSGRRGQLLRNNRVIKKENEALQYNVTEEDVRFHLELLQKIIQRMADSSSSIKKWCITVVSGMIMFSFGSGADMIMWSLGPLFMFLLLDTNYKALERKFIVNYDSFVERLCVKYPGESSVGCNVQGNYNYIKKEEIFEIKPPKEVYKYYGQAFKELEICVFYIFFALFIFVFWMCNI